MIPPTVKNYITATKILSPDGWSKAQNLAGALLPKQSALLGTAGNQGK